MMDGNTLVRCTIKYFNGNTSHQIGILSEIEDRIAEESEMFPGTITEVIIDKY